jgi:hypothetical protein
LRGIANLSHWIEEDMGDRVTPEAHAQMEMLRGRVHRMEAMIDGHSGVLPDRPGAGATRADRRRGAAGGRGRPAGPAGAKFEVVIEPGMPLL